MPAQTLQPSNVKLGMIQPQSLDKIYVFWCNIDMASEKNKSGIREGKALPLPKSKINEFCRRHHIKKLSVFGSILRDDFSPESDIDILVEFEQEHIPGLAFFAMEQELSQMLGRKVDLNTLQFLSPYFRNDVEAESEVQYAAS